MNMVQPRLPDDFGALNAIEARRYIAACDYRENNEYWSVADQVINSIETGAARPVIVDIGSGPGTLCECLRDIRSDIVAIGVDKSRSMILHAKEKYPLCTFIKGDAECLPLSSESVDVAVSVNTLHHLSDVDKAISEIVRVLKPNGLGYLVDLRRDAETSEVERKLERMHGGVSSDLMRSLKSALTPGEMLQLLKGKAISEVRVECGPIRTMSARLENDPFMHENDWPIYYRAVFRKYRAV